MPPGRLPIWPVKQALIMFLSLGFLLVAPATASLAAGPSANFGRYSGGVQAARDALEVSRSVVPSLPVTAEAGADELARWRLDRPLHEDFSPASVKQTAPIAASHPQPAGKSYSSSGHIGSVAADASALRREFRVLASENGDGEQSRRSDASPVPGTAELVSPPAVNVAADAGAQMLADWSLHNGLSKVVKEDAHSGQSADSTRVASMERRDVQLKSGVTKRLRSNPRRSISDDVAGVNAAMQEIESPQSDGGPQRNVGLPTPQAQHLQDKHEATPQNVDAGANLLADWSLHHGSSGVAAESTYISAESAAQDDKTGVAVRAADLARRSMTSMMKGAMEKAGAITPLPDIGMDAGAGALSPEHQPEVSTAGDSLEKRGNAKRVVGSRPRRSISDDVAGVKAAMHELVSSPTVSNSQLNVPVSDPVALDRQEKHEVQNADAGANLLADWSLHHGLQGVATGAVPTTVETESQDGKPDRAMHAADVARSSMTSMMKGAPIDTGVKAPILYNDVASGAGVPAREPEPAARLAHNISTDAAALKDSMQEWQQSQTNGDNQAIGTGLSTAVVESQLATKEAASGANVLANWALSHKSPGSIPEGHSSDVTAIHTARAQESVSTYMTKMMTGDREAPVESKVTSENSQQDLSIVTQDASTPEPSIVKQRNISGDEADLKAAMHEWQSSQSDEAVEVQGSPNPLVAESLTSIKAADSGAHLLADWSLHHGLPALGAQTAVPGGAPDAPTDLAAHASEVARRSMSTLMNSEVGRPSEANNLADNDRTKQEHRYDPTRNISADAAGLRASMHQWQQSQSDDAEQVQTKGSQLPPAFEGSQELTSGAKAGAEQLASWTEAQARAASQAAALAAQNQESTSASAGIEASTDSDAPRMDTHQPAHASVSTDLADLHSVMKEWQKSQMHEGMQAMGSGASPAVAESQVVTKEAASGANVLANWASHHKSPALPAADPSDVNFDHASHAEDSVRTYMTKVMTGYREAAAGIKVSSEMIVQKQVVAVSDAPMPKTVLESARNISADEASLKAAMHEWQSSQSTEAMPVQDTPNPLDLESQTGVRSSDSGANLLAAWSLKHGLPSASAGTDAVAGRPDAGNDRSSHAEELARSSMIHMMKVEADRPSEGGASDDGEPREDVALPARNISADAAELKASMHQWQQSQVRDVGQGQGSESKDVLPTSEGTQVLTSGAKAGAEQLAKWAETQARIAAQKSAFAAQSQDSTLAPADVKVKTSADSGVLSMDTRQPAQAAVSTDLADLHSAMKEWQKTQVHDQIQVMASVGSTPVAESQVAAKEAASGANALAVWSLHHKLPQVMSEDDSGDANVGKAAHAQDVVRTYMTKMMVGDRESPADNEVSSVIAAPNQDVIQDKATPDTFVKPSHKISADEADLKVAMHEWQSSQSDKAVQASVSPNTPGTKSHVGAEVVSESGAHLLAEWSMHHGLPAAVAQTNSLAESPDRSADRSSSAEELARLSMQNMMHAEAEKPSEGDFPAENERAKPESSIEPARNISADAAGLKASMHQWQQAQSDDVGQGQGTESQDFSPTSEGSQEVTSWAKAGAGQLAKWTEARAHVAAQAAALAAQAEESIAASAGVNAEVSTDVDVPSADARQPAQATVSSDLADMHSAMKQWQKSQMHDVMQAMGSRLSSSEKTPGSTSDVKMSPSQTSIATPMSLGDAQAAQIGAAKLKEWTQARAQAAKQRAEAAAKKGEAAVTAGSDKDEDDDDDEDSNRPQVVAPRAHLPPRSVSSDLADMKSAMGQWKEDHRVDSIHETMSSMRMHNNLQAMVGKTASGYKEAKAPAIAETTELRKEVDDQDRVPSALTVETGEETLRRWSQTKAQEAKAAADAESSNGSAPSSQKSAAPAQDDTPTRAPRAATLPNLEPEELTADPAAAEAARQRVSSDDKALKLSMHEWTLASHFDDMRRPVGSPKGAVAKVSPLSIQKSFAKGASHSAPKMAASTQTGANLLRQWRKQHPLHVSTGA